MKLVVNLIKALFWVGVLCIPLLGVWIASSLAAYGDGSTWFALAAGALAFPLLPLAWEALAARLRSRKAKNSSFLEDLDSRRRNERALTLADRLLLRTLAVNLVFVVGLLSLSPRTAFNALTARGDWFLDGVERPWAPPVRLAILRAADKAEWLANLQPPNPYAQDTDRPVPSPPEPREAPSERVAVSIAVPDGAVAQLGDELPPVRVEGQTSIELVPDLTIPIKVYWEDGRKEFCRYTPTHDGEIAFSERDGAMFLKEGPAWRPCVHVQAADLDWKPELRLLDRFGREAGPVITADGIAAVKIREPYYRVELTAQASDQLCEITREHPFYPLALVVDGAVQYRTPEDAQTQCTGSVSFPMFELPEGAEPPDQPQEAYANWPMPQTLHPLIADFPDEYDVSIAAVGRYIQAHESDPWLRVKAIHDYVVTRITYDKSSLQEGRRAPQDADTVFRTRTGVCAGYAHLMVALGQATGDEIVYLVGDARQDLGDIAGAPHAWNAARIEGQWVLIDATWDVGDSASGTFEERYTTDYLFTPPEVFRLSHKPTDDRWQLADPIGTGEFNRLPLLRPGFFAADLGLVDPARAQVPANGDAVIRISNPSRAKVQLVYEMHGTQVPCVVEGVENIKATCSLPSSGTQDVLIFHGPAGATSLAYGGRIQFTHG